MVEVVCQWVMYQKRRCSCWLALIGSVIILGWFQPGAIAANLEPYVLRYLDAREPVELPLNAQGETQTFSAEQLSVGQRLFEESCKSCHVGGATLPNPNTPLSITALQAATPPRDTIQALTAFMRMPMTYDGTEQTFWCREIPESWLSEQELEAIAAFVLRAAQKAPGWGESQF
jgi:photosystem II cytochrome c550